MVVDRPIVTEGEVAHYRPDMAVSQRDKVTLIKVAVAWDPIVAEREREKRIKYQGLAADIAGQYDATKPVHVCTVVIGAPGTVCQMGHNLVHSGLLEADDVWRLAGSIQNAVLIRAVQIMKRHLASQEREG